MLSSTISSYRMIIPQPHPSSPSSFKNKKSILNNRLLYPKHSRNPPHSEKAKRWQKAPSAGHATSGNSTRKNRTNLKGNDRRRDNIYQKRPAISSHTLSIATLPRQPLRPIRSIRRNHAPGKERKRKRKQNPQ